ncbi:MAG TPA: SRPBCC domain-containing protein [Acidimicrobiia bacterium]|nr:SRPBCC domain-containing protein [Acidimicrobiia bacterium]
MSVRETCRRSSTERFVAAPPAEVDAYLADSEQWARWQRVGASHDPRPGGPSRLQMANGMTARGQFVDLDPPHRVVVHLGLDRPPRAATYRCYHGKMTIPQLVLEWKLFERVLLRQQMPFPGRPTHILIDFRLTPNEAGTKLNQAVTRPTGTLLKRSLARAMIKMRADRTHRDMREFRDRIQDDLSAHEPMPGSSIPIPIEQITSQAAGKPS